MPKEKWPQEGKETLIFFRMENALNPLHSEKEILEILNSGRINIQGQFIFGSNYSFLADVNYKDQPIKAVYKPNKGERPLWDFPAETLANREVAAFLISRALGWNFVPPTVIREDAPLGKGSLQFFIPHDPNLNYFTFPGKIHKKLKRVALFDIIINNADRKASHILLDDKENIWLIDHGLCFHTENKLRTVIWNFGGEEIQQKLIAEIMELLEKFTQKSDEIKEFENLLSYSEIDAFQNRIRIIMENKTYPISQKNRRSYPFPLV